MSDCLCKDWWWWWWLVMMMMVVVATLVKAYHREGTERRVQFEAPETPSIGSLLPCSAASNR